jgi:hypothetical protein
LGATNAKLTKNKLTHKVHHCSGIPINQGAMMPINKGNAQDIIKPKDFKAFASNAGARLSADLVISLTQNDFF